MDTHRIADVLEVFLKAGVDTILGKLDQDVMRDAMKMAEDRTGRGIIKIGTPGLDISSAPEADDTNLRTLDQQVSNCLTLCLPHAGTTDALVDRRHRCIQGIDDITHAIRERGMIPGLSTHTPESIVFADERSHDVATYI